MTTTDELQRGVPGLIERARGSVHNQVPFTSYLGTMPADDFERLGLAQVRRHCEQTGASRAVAVVNTEPHDQAGRHWVMVGFRRAPGADAWQGEFFDSYGSQNDAGLLRLLQAGGGPPPYHEHIVQHLQRLTGRPALLENRFVWQALATDVCGEYAALACAFGLPSDGSRVWRRLARLKNLPGRPTRDETVKGLVGLRA
eukprot:m.262552 g.262552  ORF g.262552 m.262552 type:complete len:199 (-) comp11048_c0_seq6:5285-5881(-)